MSITVCVLAVPEPSREEGVALINQRIYPEKQDVVQFEDEEILYYTSSLVKASAVLNALAEHFIDNPES